MSKHTLHITISAKDIATKPLKAVQQTVNDTGRAVKRANADIIQFNRVMFSTSAFVWLFQKKVQGLFEVLQEGSHLDRLETQFENVLGPKSGLFEAISSLTSASIDKFEAMRSGIALRTLGIANNVDDIAEIITGAGVAAKRAGMDSGEGIKKVTEALKDGNLSHLEFLNLIRTNDAGLKAQLSILGKYSGVLGTAVTAQQKHALILSIVRSVARSAENETRDLQDVLADLGQGFKFATAEGGRFLGTALAPVIDKVTKVVQVFTDLSVKMRQSKEFLFLAKSIGVATSALAAFFGTIYTGKMLVMGMMSLGIGPKSLFFTLASMATGFRLLTDGANGAFDRLKLFGGIVKGVSELVENFNEASGTSEITSSLEKLLSGAGVFGFVKIIARMVITTKTYLTELGTVLKDVFQWVDNSIGNITLKFFKLFGFMNKPWAREFIDSTKPLYKMVVKLGAGLAGLILVAKALKFIGLGGIFAKIPLIGRFFGSGSKPDGSQSRPFYTKSLDRISNYVSKETGEMGILIGKISKLFGLTEFIENMKKAAMAALMFSGAAIGAAGSGAALGYATAELILFTVGLENLRKAFDKVGSIFGASPTSQEAKDKQLAKLQSPYALDMMTKYQQAGVFLSAQDQLDRMDTYKGRAFSLSSGKEEDIWAGKPGVPMSPEATIQNRLLRGRDVAGGGLPSVAQTPTMNPEGHQLAIKNLMEEDLKLMDEASQAKMTAAWKTANEDGVITKEEMASIFQYAINSSNLTTHAEVTAKETIKANNKPTQHKASPRGNC